MVHKFNVDNFKKLDSPKRRKLIPPKETLERLFLKEGDVVGDVGCGIGYFSLPASRIVGENGVVYGIDNSPKMLNELKLRVEEENLENVKPIEANDGRIDLPSDLITYAFISNVLHEIEDLSSFLDEIKRTMKKKARIVIIEWEKKVGEMGPPIEHRLSKEYMKEFLINNSFNEIEIIELNSELYAVTGILK